MTAVAAAVAVAAATAGCAGVLAPGCEPHMVGSGLSFRAKPAFIVPQPARRMAAFTLPRTAADVLPLDRLGRRVVVHLYDDDQRTIEQMGQQGTPPYGRIVAGESRRLFAARGIAVYAAPTQKGGVCWEIPAAVGVCEEKTMSFRAISGASTDVPRLGADSGGPCRLLTVVGVVPDGVVAVSVVVAGRERRATMGHNAFVYVGTGSTDDVTQVIVHYRGGGRVVTNVS